MYKSIPFPTILTLVDQKLCDDNIDSKHKNILINIKHIIELKLNTDFGLTNCIKSFDVPKSTFYKYLNIIINNEPIVRHSNRPKTIKFEYDWVRINNYIKHMLANKKQKYYITKATILMRINKKFNINISSTTFYKQIDLSRYRKKKKKPISFKRFEIATPGYIQIDGINLNKKEYVNKKSRHHIYTAIDQYSRMTFAYCYDEKCRSNSIDFAKRAINYFQSKKIIVKHIRTDNGPEYVHTKKRLVNGKLHKIMSEFEILLHNLGISHDTIIPGFPNQNGKVERFNESLINEHINYMYDNYENQIIQEINKNLKSYIKYYNEQRFHTILKKTPQQVIKNYFIDGVINDHVFTK